MASQVNSHTVTSGRRTVRLLLIGSNNKTVEKLLQQKVSDGQMKRFQFFTNTSI